MGMQRDIWVKIGVWGKWACKGTFRLKMGFGGKMGMQKDFWVKNRVLLEKTNSSYRNNPSHRN